MALPTAPLGQLSNLSVPHSMPMYQKPQSTLDKALQAFLVGVATQAGGQIAENTFSRDYADDKAGVLSKVVSGPKMGEREYLQSQAQDHDYGMEQERNFNANQRQQVGIDATRELSDREAINRAAEAELARIDQMIYGTSMEDQRSKNEMERLLKGEEMALNRGKELETLRDTNDDDRQTRAAQDAMALESLRRHLEGTSPQGEYYRQQAIGQETINKVRQGYLNNQNPQQQGMPQASEADQAAKAALRQQANIAPQSEPIPGLEEIQRPSREVLAALQALGLDPSVLTQAQ